MRPEPLLLETLELLSEAELECLMWESALVECAALVSENRWRCGELLKDYRKAIRAIEPQTLVR